MLSTRDWAISTGRLRLLPALSSPRRIHPDILVKSSSLQHEMETSSPPRLHSPACLIQAIYRGHRTRRRIWQDPLAAYIFLSAHIERYCGFWTSSSMSPPPDHIVSQFRAPTARRAFKSSTSCSKTSTVTHEHTESQEGSENCPSDSRTLLGSNTASTATPMPPMPCLPPVPSVAARRSRTAILAELRWVNSSLRQRVRVRSR